MLTKERRFLTEQLQLLLDELNGASGITADFLRVHLASVNEHAQCLIESLPPPPESLKPFLM